jgi:hypothetical protein
MKKQTTISTTLCRNRPRLSKQERREGMYKKYKNDSTPGTRTGAKAAPPRADPDLYIFLALTSKKKRRGSRSGCRNNPMAAAPHVKIRRLSDQTLGSPFIMIQFVPRLRQQRRTAPSCQILSYKTFRPRMNCCKNFPKCPLRD